MPVRGSEKLPAVPPPALPDHHPQVLPLCQVTERPVPAARRVEVTQCLSSHSAVSSVTSLTSENTTGLYSGHAQDSPDGPRHG